MMLLRNLTAAIFTLVLMGCPASLEDFIEAPLTNADISKGLKEALNFGTDEAVSFLSAQDGYY